MTDETEVTETTSETTEPGDATVADDSRFEVKWRKKESSSSASSASPQATVASATDDVAELRGKLVEAEKRAAELQDRWHRAAADLANLRKRNEADRNELEKFASMLVVAEMLPVLDNFERALATIPQNLVMLTWIQGVMLIDRHLRSILESQGLAAIEAGGQAFNPHQHEAIGEQETDKVPPGHVSQVYQKGYTMHGRVIRPALVELAKAPASAEQVTEVGVAENTIDGADMADNASEENTGS